MRAYWVTACGCRLLDMGRSGGPDSRLPIEGHRKRMASTC